MQDVVILIILAIPPALYALIRLITPLLQRRRLSPDDSIQHRKPPDFRLLRLKAPKTGTRTWTIVAIVAATTSAVLLVLAGLMLYLLIAKQDTPQLDIGSVMFLIFMIILPIWLLTDIAVVEWRRRKNGRSWVAAPAELELESDFNSLFNKCQEVLNDMGARTTRLDVQNRFIEAELDQDRITIQIEQIGDSRHQVLILSDCKLPSVKFDLGRNRRNVDEFIQRLLHSR